MAPELKTDVDVAYNKRLEGLVDTINQHIDSIPVVGGLGDGTEARNIMKDYFLWAARRFVAENTSPSGQVVEAHVHFWAYRPDGALWHVKIIIGA